MSTILLVEDDEGILHAIREALRDAGHTVSTEIGWRALRFAEERRPDLILLDMMLPLLDGPDILAYLHHNGPTSGIPVVVMTAMQGVRDEVQSLGACAYLPKPFDIDDLLAVVTRCLEKGTST